MKLTEKQKQLLADAIATYDEVCWWKYSSTERKSEAFNMGELPPTKLPVTQEMFLERIAEIIEDNKK